MGLKPLDRALVVYVQMTGRQPSRAELEKTVTHIKELRADGETDEERLTVRALTFLRAHDNVERLRTPTEVG